MLTARRPRLGRAKSMVTVILSCLGKVNSVLNYFGIVLVSIVLAAAMIIGVTQVFARYLFQSSLMWSEEAMRYLLVWLVFLVLPIAIRQGRHLTLDIFVNRARPATKKIVYVLTNILCILLFIILFIDSMRLLSAIQFQRASSFPAIHVKYIYAIIPLSLAIVLFQYVEIIVRELSKKEDGLR